MYLAECADSEKGEEEEGRDETSAFPSFEIEADTGVIRGGGGWRSKSKEA